MSTQVLGFSCRRLDSGPATFMLPVDCFVVSCGVIDSQLYFWVLGDDDGPKEERILTFVPTTVGEVAGPIEVARDSYVGHALVSGVVWHVWDGDLAKK